MTKISIPNNNIPERKYIIDILFNEFLGIEYKIEIGSEEYEIVLENSQVLTIEDTFFNKYPNDLEYLKLENIPSSIEELDLFAASFFMLTRWEEYVNKVRDEHGRFPSSESLAVREGFWDRPIVNELLEGLKKKLLAHDDRLIFKQRKFTPLVTHDVDYIHKWYSYPMILRHLIGDIVGRRSIKSFLSTIGQYINFKRGREKDPYDTFDYLMDTSEKMGIKSHFFFMAEGKTKYDSRYKTLSIATQEIVSQIKKRGHLIGIHPTYNAYDNIELLRDEKHVLEKDFGADISCGREHYLRFEIPTTWQTWEENQMEWDSTLGYADREGFRCGVCYDYSVFNILTREKLHLKEKPLIVMEVSVVHGKNTSTQEMKNRIVKQIKLVKEYNGEFVLLWHNSSFNTDFWSKYAKVYEEILAEATA